MTLRASVFIATSVDGFIARTDGAIDWLPAQTDDEDYGYQAFMDSVDALVMGSNTFALASSFTPWPYGSKPVVVLSSRALAIPPALAGTVESMCASPHAVMQRLAARGLRHVYVDGGRTIQGFLRDGLIDRLIITRIPILLGSGRPLFGTVARDVQLRHVATQAYPNGLVQSTYDVLRS